MSDRDEMPDSDEMVFWRDDISFWRDDIDSLAFQPANHQGFCVMHRQAFRTLLEHEPTPQSCLDYFKRLQPVFQQAALEKIQRAEIALTASFHLNSRNIRRVLAAQNPPSEGNANNTFHRE